MSQSQSQKIKTHCYFDAAGICIGYQQGGEQWFYPNANSVLSGEYLLDSGYYPQGKMKQELECFSVS